MNVIDRLQTEILFFDGAMGTMLQSQGLEPGELPEIWNITKGDAILSIHKEYLEAGCNIIKSNTFGVNPFKLKGTGHTCEELTQKGIHLAKEAIAETGKDAYVALDIGSLGKLLEPLGDLPFEDAYRAFSQVYAMR